MEQLGAHASVEEVMSLLDRDGYAIVEGVLVRAETAWGRQARPGARNATGV